MLYRITILFVMMTLCVGSLPLITHGQRGGQSLLQEGRRLALSTKRVDHPDGRTVDSLSGRHQRGDKTISLSAFVVKKGIKSRRSGPRSQNPASNALFTKVSMTNTLPRSLASQPGQDLEMVRDRPYDPGYDYYYAYSEMARPDGAVMANASYEYQASTNQNTLYITLGGVTQTFDLTTEEALPISDAEADQLNAWAATEDASLVKDASATIITEGWQQADTEMLLNYYAIAMLVDFTPPTASIPRASDPEKNALHHAVGNLVSKSDNSNGPRAGCLNVLNVSFTSANALVSSGILAPTSPIRAFQCFGCCGLGCYCITNQSGPIYTSACAEHDYCVGQYGYTSCRKKFVKAAVSVWYSIRGYF